MTVSRLLWFAAGVDASIMKQCPPRERMRYALFGTAVFIPTFLALFGSASALTYLTDSWQLIAFISVTWAFIVFSLDRMLMMDDGKFTWGYLMRILLAVGVALFLSVPIELKLFKESIDKAIVRAQDSTAKSYVKVFQYKIDSIEKKIDYLDDKWKAKRLEFEDEMVGIRGSGKIGIGPIAENKRQIYKNDSSSIADQIRLLKIQEDVFLLKISDKVVNGYVESVCADDLLARIEALNQLAQRNQSIDWSIWILRMVLILLEIIPVAVKSNIGKKGVYQSLQQSLDEKIIEINQQLKNETVEMSILFERLENINKRLKARLEHGKIRATSIFERLKFQQDEILRGIEEKKKFELELLQTELDDVTRIVVEKTKERVFQEFFEGVTTLFDEPDNN